MGLLTSLSLFSGAGGLDLAGRWTGRVRTVAYVEIDPYAQAVLQSRIRSGDLDDDPIWDDIHTFDAAAFRGIDVVSGGFPCQPANHAGRRKGASDERWLWPEFARVIREARPRFVLAENVPGLLSVDAGQGFGEVLRDLAALGYDAEWCVRSAADAGAPHLRERVWIVAYAARVGRGERRAEPAGQQGRPNASSGRPSVADTNGRGLEVGLQRNGESSTRKRAPQRDDVDGCDTDVADTGPGRRPGRTRELRPGRRGEPADGRWRSTEPDVDGKAHGLARGLDGTGRGRPPLVPGWPEGWEDGLTRVSQGVPFRVDRLRCIGNGVVPQCALPAWEKIVRMAG